MLFKYKFNSISHIRININLHRFSELSDFVIAYNYVLPYLLCVIQSLISIINNLFMSSECLGNCAIPQLTVIFTFPCLHRSTAFGSLTVAIYLLSYFRSKSRIRIINSSPHGEQNIGLSNALYYLSKIERSLSPTHVRMYR